MHWFRRSATTMVKSKSRVTRHKDDENPRVTDCLQAPGTVQHHPRGLRKLSGDDR